MNAEQMVYNFEFQDDLLLYQKINAVSAVQAQAFVFDWQRVLP